MKKNDNKKSPTQKKDRSRQEQTRRAKINHWINELKNLIQEYNNNSLNMTNIFKLDKAEILEITLKQINNNIIQQNQSSKQQQTNIENTTFINGYKYGQEEAINYLDNLNNMPIDLRTDLRNSLKMNHANFDSAIDVDQQNYLNENKCNQINEENQLMSINNLNVQEKIAAPVKNRQILEKLRHKIFENRRKRFALQRQQRGQMVDNGENMWRPWY